MFVLFRPLVLSVLTAAALLVGCLPWLALLYQQGLFSGIGSVLLPITGLMLFAGVARLFATRFYCRTILRARYLQQPLSGLEHWLYTTSFRLALRRQINPPRIAVYPSSELNAFALGLQRQHAEIVLSEGLVQGLKTSELESVLAHEISHVANGDVQILGWLQGVLSVLVIFPARLLDYLVVCCWRGYASGGVVYAITVVLLQLAGGWLASLLIMHFSRGCEYRADRSAAQLVGVKQMCDTLCRLDNIMAGSQNQQLAAFGLSARIKFRCTQLFNSHPSLPDRLQALREGK